MKIFSKRIFRNLTALLLLLNSYAYSVHVWGGELEASCDGNNNYTFRLSLYVDCGRVNGMPTSESISVYSKTGTLVQNVTLSNFIKDTLPTVPNPCAKTVVGTCIGRVIAQGTVNLPMSADGYVISYSSCCRNSNIGNITNPGGTGQIYSIELPGTNDVSSCNSSPTFNALPPSEICTNLPVEIDFSATDSDGDDLKYKLFHPYGDQNGTFSGGPPFPQITFTPPYSFNNPMNSGLTIDENTGIITGIPQESGLFALGVVVEEYRNGVLIGKKVRDFTYTVVQCIPTLSTGEPSVLTCADEPVYFSFEFDGILKQGTTPIWEFGDPTSGDNSSTLFDPNHQYSSLGSYVATVTIQDSCGNELNDSIKVEIVETVANVDDPGDFCKGDDVTLTCTDSPCDLTEWYADETSVTPIHTGCTYDFNLSQDRMCIYFEPFVDPNDYTVGATGPLGWGTDATNSMSFDAITPLTIEGFTLHGDQYWNGCTNFNGMLTVEQNGSIIAGPEFITVDCDGITNITGLSLDVPQGTGFELKISGATVRPGDGGPVNQVGLIKVNSAGPFYNVLVHSNQKCARRDSICIESDCPCPDTSLTFPPNFCANQDFDLGTLKTTTTSVGSWSIKTSPTGTSPAIITNDSIFDGAGADAGNYTVLYTIDGNWPGCIVENERDIEVYSVDSANIPDHGPYCEADGNQTIQYSGTTTTGGNWSSDATGSINATTGVFNPVTATIGTHWVFYDSPSANCPARDSIEVEITGGRKAEIITADTSICLGTNNFVIRTSADSDQGIWTGYSNDSLFSPDSSGTFIVKYAVYGQTASCSDSDSLTITVMELDTAEITPDQGPFCKLGGNQNIALKLNSTPGGTWTSLTANAISAAGVFNPLTADIGTHKVIYTTAGSCPNDDTLDIEVINALSADIVTPDTNICVGSTPFVIRKGTQTTNGGSWIGTHLTDSLFTPTTAGTFEVKYIIEGLTPACSDSDSITITVVAPDTANITPNQGPYCKLGGNQVLTFETGTTTGGTWTSLTAGAIATDGTFNPLIADTGSHTVIYTTPGILCPVADTLPIVVINALEAEITLPDTSICLGSTPFVIRKSSTTPNTGAWTGQNLNDSLFSPLTEGTFIIKYSVSGLTAACSDSDSVSITVVTPDTVEITNHGPYCVFGNLDTIEYSNNTTIGGIWSSPTGTINANNGEFDPSGSGSGNHWIYYTSPGTMCGTIDSIEVEVVSLLEANINNGDTSVCAASTDFTLRLNPTSYSQGVWSGNGVSASTFSPTVSGEGTFKIFYETSGLGDACSDIDSVEITVLPNQNATITTPSPNEFCEGDSSITIVTADTSGTGIWWSVPAGNISANGEFNPSTSSAGDYEVFYGIAGQCGDSSSTELVIHEVKDPSITQLNTVCEIAGDQSLNAVDVGLWSINGLSNNGNFSPSNLGPGRHRIINAIKDNCPVADTIYVDVKQNPSLQLGADTAEGCYPMPVTFSDLTDSSALTTTWTILDGTDTIFQTSQLDSLEFIFGNKGCYDINIASTFDYGCANTTTLPYQICTHTPPDADFIFTKDPVDVKDPLVFTQNQSLNANSFLWKFNGGRPLIENDNELVVEYNIDEQDTVDISLVATNGWCSDTITKSLIIWDFFTLNVPNAFTPNGDGLNELFFPMGRNHVTENFLFVIYNRWGDRIFETTNPYDGWDGTYKKNGKPCQEDVYVWKVLSRDIFEDELVQKTGAVALIR